MKIIEGDLIELSLNNKFDVIIHGCNCYCMMGAGIAKQIKHKFPEAYKVDLLTMVGNARKLGSFSYVKTIQNKNHLIIVNAYTQFKYWGRHVKTDYKAIKEVFKRIRLKFSGKRIGYPMIGAGLGGGDWNIISKIINEELEGENHTLVKLPSI